jgi:hypothetical protein
VHRPGTPQHPCREHRRAPSAGETTKPLGGIVRLAPTPRHLGEEILEGSGTSQAQRVARRALHGVHASDGSAAGARRVARARDRCGGVRARGKEAHRVDMFALAQGALDSGARCALFSAPFCAPRGERAPFVGREGRWSRRPYSRRGFESHVRAYRGTLPLKDEA